MKRLVALVLALMMLSCVALGEGEGLHYLTKEDITQIYNPDALASYQHETGRRSAGTAFHGNCRPPGRAAL